MIVLHRKVMKGIAAIFLFCATPLLAQIEHKPEWKDVVGTWTGYYMESGQQKAITLVFNDLEGKCTVDMPDHSIKSATFDVAPCQAGDFHITQTGPGRQYTFVGKPVDDTMTGIYKIGSTCGPGGKMEFRVKRR